MTTYAVAPDSARVAWIEASDGEAGPLRISPLDRLRVRTPPLLETAARAGWSPDGGRLAVTARDADGFGLFVVDPATGAARSVVAGVLSTESAPAWLDASRVVFPISDNQSFDWVDVDSGERGTLVDLELGWVFYPCRLGDGSLLFMLNQRGGRGQQLWRLPPGGDATLTSVPWTKMQGMACTASGDAILFDQVTGEVGRVDPTSGTRTPLAPAMLVPPQKLSAVAVLAGGDLLFTIEEDISDVFVAVPE